MNPLLCTLASHQAMDGQRVHEVTVMHRTALLASEQVRFVVEWINWTGCTQGFCRLILAAGGQKKIADAVSLAPDAAIVCEVTGFFAKAGDNLLTVLLETGEGSSRRSCRGEFWFHIAAAVPRVNNVSVVANSQTGGDATAAAVIHRGDINVSVERDAQGEAAKLAVHSLLLTESVPSFRGRGLLPSLGLRKPGFIGKPVRLEHSPADPIPGPRPKPAMYRNGLAAVLVIAGLVAGAAWLWRERPRTGGAAAHGVAASPEQASAALPFQNAAGMLLLSVSGPGAPTGAHREILAGATEVTVGVYRRFAEAAEKEGRILAGSHEPLPGAPGEFASWERPGYPQTDAYPVTFVSRADADAFCEWLTRQDRRRWPDAIWHYRLPFDAEWSLIAGPNTRPAQVAPQPLPADALAANDYGFYGAGGNVAEWIADRPLGSDHKALARDCGWLSGPNSGIYHAKDNELLPPKELPDQTAFRGLGFRVVLEIP